MNPENSYLLPEVALDALSQRATVKSLVEEWWQEQGWGIPSFLVPGTTTVLARQVPTFRFEDAAFVTIARQAGLTPVWWGYIADRLVSASNYKRSLLHPLYYERTGRNGGLVVKRRKLADISRWDGRPLSAIQTFDGQSLVDYHTRHLDQCMPGAIVTDCTQWYNQIGKASQYYPAYLSLYLAHTVLCEDYHGGESGNQLDAFTLNVFEPAWRFVKRHFGVTPLIMKLPWVTEFGYYPDPALVSWQDSPIVTQAVEALYASAS